MAVWIHEPVAFFDFVYEKDTFIFDTFEERRLIRAGLGVYMDDELAELLYQEKARQEEELQLKEFVEKSGDDSIKEAYLKLQKPDAGE